VASAGEMLLRDEGRLLFCFCFRRLGRAMHGIIRGLPGLVLCVVIWFPLRDMRDAFAFACFCWCAAHSSHR
jgi:hypothetical protein